MAPFTCKCENKSYSGWFNNKKCKDCGTIIYNRKNVDEKGNYIGSATNGYAWRTKRIKDLEAEVQTLKRIITES